MTKNWVDIKNDLHGTYNTSSHKVFKTSMLNSSLCDHSDASYMIKEL